MGINSKKTTALPVLIDDELQINFNIEGFSHVVSNLKELNFKLAAKFEISDQITVHGLIGVDMIQFIPSLKFIKCMHGSAIQIPTGIIPFGNKVHFLYNHQVIPIKGGVSLPAVITLHSTSPKTQFG